MTRLQRLRPSVCVGHSAGASRGGVLLRFCGGVGGDPRDPSQSCGVLMVSHASNATRASGAEARSMSTAAVGAGPRRGTGAASTSPTTTTWWSTDSARRSLSVRARSRATRTIRPRGGTGVAAWTCLSRARRVRGASGTAPRMALRRPRDSRRWPLAAVQALHGCTETAGQPLPLYGVPGDAPEHARVEVRPDQTVLLPERRRGVRKPSVVLPGDDHDGQVRGEPEQGLEVAELPGVRPLEVQHDEAGPLPTDGRQGLHQGRHGSHLQAEGMTSGERFLDPRGCGLHDQDAAGAFSGMWEPRALGRRPGHGHEHGRLGAAALRRAWPDTTPSREGRRRRARHLLGRVHVPADLRRLRSAVP